MSFDLAGYKTVPQRLAEFRAAYPEGRLRAANPDRPYYVETIGTQSYIVYVAAAYRTADDPAPGIGIAWECVPGKTQFTKDSELQNAETSAWGRAVVAALIVDPGTSVASREDVESRQGDGAEQSRIDALKDAIKSADAWRWVSAQKFAYPWSEDVCCAIEAHLETL